MRRVCALVSVLVAGTVLAAPAAAAETSTIVTFDAAAGELPEGVAVDKKGTIYVTLQPTGELLAITPDGSQRLHALLPVGGFGPLGLAVDASGDVYVCVVTFEAATHGVYRVASDGSFSRLPGTAAITFPNGLAFDKRGNLYITDSILGAVWRIPRFGSAEPWLQHPLLAGDDSAPVPFPVGANGIGFRHGVVYVTNTELGRLVAVPVRPDGSAGSPEILAEHPALIGADGLALDVHGGIYVAVIVQSTIVRVSPDGSSLTTVATAADGLDFASSIAFGTGMGYRQTLFVVNFAIGPIFGEPLGAGPALLSLDAGVPGLPQP